jgi:hypothetical protein
MAKPLFSDELWETLQPLLLPPKPRRCSRRAGDVSPLLIEGSNRGLMPSLAEVIPGHTQRPGTTKGERPPTSPTPGGNHR